jgi:hypothetical protein
MTTVCSDGFLAERPEPEQRVWALKQARQVITTTKAPFGGTNEISPIDLVSLSQYILTGTDPYAVTPVAAPEAVTG